MLFKNVELMWVALDPEKVDMGFDKNTPQWTLTMVTRDKDVSKVWKTAEYNVKVGEDDQGIVYTVKVNQPKFRKDGTENKPIPVVGRDLMPFDHTKLASIGNGTVANVKVWEGDYNYNGKKGKMFRLEAVQIVELKEYAGGGSAISGFANLDGESPFTDETDEDAY